MWIRPIESALALSLLAVLASTPTSTPALASSAPSRPNVIVVITDDQGYGDLGIHGNARIRTPNIDRLANEGARFTHFYVSPVCSLTRASLLTGRYNYRTGIVDTYLGRSIMDPAEVTLADRLSRAGYRTGIFGKWHLGDNLPLRPIDRGFQEALVLKGGGIGQSSDLPGGSHYHDPVLLKNGRPERYAGYCSDVYTTAAIEFINAAEKDQPFFVYLAFNCPHTPLEAPEPELSSYMKEREKLEADQFPSEGYPLPRTLDTEKTAKLYAMVTNIDANVGRLLSAVDANGIAESTIVVFLTDNGPAFPRYNAGLRGLKGSTYEGGIRVPFFIRWPGRFPRGREVAQATAHIDFTPTILEACGVPVESGPKLDGRSFLPLLRGETVEWPERTLYSQWHRGDVPELGRSFAASDGQYKLIRPEQSTGNPRPALELYDLRKDPFEQTDLAGKHPEIVARMFHDYADWFRDVRGERACGVIRIRIGDPRENPTLLTRQDWHPVEERAPGLGGFWELDVARPGRYAVSLNVEAKETPGRARLMVQKRVLEQPVAGGAQTVVFRDVALEAGPARLHVWLDGSQPVRQIRDVSLTRTGGG